MTREVSIQRTARDVWTLRVGDTELELNPCEAWVLEHALRDAVFPQDQRQRLQTALRVATDEVYDILEHDERQTRAYDLTREDWKRLVWLGIRVDSPWE
ncbi:MAG: hypothetical protein KDB26_12430 [Microthrixaceae bacterium]|nr:hypothetical protein [Microthrixaceae bacterium]